MELNFEDFEMQRWSVPIDTFQIVDEKNGVICLVNTMFTQEDLSVALNGSQAVTKGLSTNNCHA